MCVLVEDITIEFILFPPSWIWAIRVSSHSQSHKLENGILGEKQNTFHKKKERCFWRVRQLKNGEST